MKQSKIRNAKFAIILITTIILTSSTVLAETNVSILYGWNGTAFAPVNIESDGSLKTTLNLSESIGIFPKDDSLYNLGSNALKWLTGYFSNVSATQVCIGADCRTTWPSGSGQGKQGDGIYLYNDTDTMYLNETKLNATIDAIETNATLLYGYNQSESEFRPVSITGDGALKMSIVEQSGLSGWVDDGTTVRLATSSDKVGIGTTSPTHELHVVGDANITGTVYAHNFSGNSDIVFLNASGAEAMRIDNAGNVGIGTTNPGNQLEVAKSSTGPAIEISTWSTTNSEFSQLQFKKSGHNTIDSYTATADDEDLGVIGWWGTDTGPSQSAQAAYIRAEQDGSAGASQIPVRLVFGTGTNAVAASDRMTIDSGGNVGFGTTSPGSPLHINGSAETLLQFTGGNGYPIIFNRTDKPTYEIVHGNPGSGDGFGIRENMTNIRFFIKDGGMIGIGTTNPNEGKIHVVINSSTEHDRALQLTDEGSAVGSGDNLLRLSYRNDADVTDATIISFEDSDNVIGSITAASATTVNYATSSDYRLKENAVNMTNGLNRLNQLKPYRFNFIGESNVTMDGFFAHEVQEIVPIAVSGEKDAINDDGTINPQGLDYSKLVPLMVKSIQELKSENNELKQRIELLEAKQS